MERSDTMTSTSLSKAESRTPEGTMTEALFGRSFILSDCECGLMIHLASVPQECDFVCQCGRKYKITIECDESDVKPKKDDHIKEN